MKNERFARWYACSLCEQKYHGVVRCALGWACWKTYLGRPEADVARMSAMTELGNGLNDADHGEDALSVREAQLSLARRLGASEYDILATQGNVASTYHKLQRHEDAFRTYRDVYSGFLRLRGEEHEMTILAAGNYVRCLRRLRHFAEAKSLLRKMAPVARRVLGEGSEITLRMRWNYAAALYQADGATLGDLREAVTTLEDTERTARRVLGGAHPITKGIEREVTMSRAALRAREDTAPGGDVNAMREAMAAMTAGDAQEGSKLTTK